MAPFCSCAGCPYYHHHRKDTRNPLVKKVILVLRNNCGTLVDHDTNRHTQRESHDRIQNRKTMDERYKFFAMMTPKRKNGTKTGMGLSPSQVKTMKLEKNKQKSYEK